MMEEIDYSEEPSRELLESAGESAEWARCLLSGMPPKYEDAKKKALKSGRNLTRKQYERALKDLGF